MRREILVYCQHKLLNSIWHYPLSIHALRSLPGNFPSRILVNSTLILLPARHVDVQELPIACLDTIEDDIRDCIGTLLYCQFGIRAPKIRLHPLKVM